MLIAFLLIFLLSGQKIVIAGGSGLGKSTLGRYILNSLLNKHGKVVCMDLDPGQSEFGLPSQFSLVSVTRPLFTFSSLHPNEHNSDDKIQKLFGDISPDKLLDHYFEIVQSFMKDLDHIDDTNSPFIINIMGYVFGNGLFIMADLFEINSTKSCDCD